MLLGEIFERFVEQSPVTVMVRGVLEKVIAPEKLDELFEKTAKVQYTARAIVLKCRQPHEFSSMQYPPVYQCRL